MAAAEMPTNVALIGGVVGGIFALLFVVGVIAFIVMRTRRAKQNPVAADGEQMTPAPSLSAQSNYGHINVSQYDVPSIDNVYEGVHDKLN